LDLFAPIEKVKVQKCWKSFHAG